MDGLAALFCCLIESLPWCAGAESTLHVNIDNSQSVNITSIDPPESNQKENLVSAPITQSEAGSIQGIMHILGLTLPWRRL